MSSKMQGVQSLRLGLERAKKRRRIQEVLDAQGMNFMGLARYAHVSHTAVYKTVSGQIHSPRVLQALRELGVPECYLFDPKNCHTTAPAPVVKPQATIPVADAV